MACRKEQRQEYYQRNKEKIKEKSRDYYYENRVQSIISVKRYQISKLEDGHYRLSKLLRSARQRAKVKELAFDIDLDYLISIWESQNGICSVSGTGFDMTPAEQRVNRNAPSIDRIIPHLGYIKGNVRLVSWHVNAAISEYGLETFISLCESVVNKNKDSK